MRSFAALLAGLPLALAGCAGSTVAPLPGATPPPGNEVRGEALPALEGAPLTRVGAAGAPAPEEPILGVEIGGEARAYPLRVLEGHAVINEVIDRMPVALAYCRPCGSAAFFRTDTPQGSLTLASSGRFRDGDQLLVDRRTGTLWAQLTGKPVEGPLAGSGIVLQPLPVVLTTWAAWSQAHPQTRVLARPASQEAGGAQPGSDPLLPVSRSSPALPETSPVFGLVLGGSAKAWPVDRVAKAGPVNDELGGQPVVIVATPGDPRNRTIRAYERGDRTFSLARTFLGVSFVSDQDGRAWKMGEEFLASPDGRKLRRLPGALTLWPGWFAAYPGTAVYGESGRPATP